MFLCYLYTAVRVQVDSTKSIVGAKVEGRLVVTKLVYWTLQGTRHSPKRGFRHPRGLNSRVPIGVRFHRGRFRVKYKHVTCMLKLYWNYITQHSMGPASWGLLSIIFKISALSKRFCKHRKCFHVVISRDRTMWPYYIIIPCDHTMRAYHETIQCDYTMRPYTVSHTMSPYHVIIPSDHTYIIMIVNPRKPV